MKNILTIIILITLTPTLNAQNKINFIDLPAEFNTELEISGMVGHNDTLYFVAERENIILVIDAVDYTLIKSIELTRAIINYNSANPDDEINIRNVEMEGVTWYQNTLLFVDEGNTAIYQFNLKRNSIKKLNTNLDMSEFYGNNGMEGIAVNPEKEIIYVLRERNGENQSEIYTLYLTDNSRLKYKHQKYIIDHPNDDWRYTDMFYDANENVIYALRSYFTRQNPESAKCYIDKIPVHKNGFLGKSVKQSKDETLSDLVIKNRCKYVSNLEGIYKTGNKIFIVSDNQRSTKKCDKRPIKTMFVEYILNE